MDGPVLLAAFHAAAEAAAALHGVEVEHVRGKPRGRGYKPPVETIGARKLAIWLTVASTQCSYADLARAIGMHRDTVTSHCADVRELSMDDDIEALAEAMRSRLVQGIHRSTVWRRSQALIERCTHPTPSDKPSDEKINFDGPKVVPLAGRARA